MAGSIFDSNFFATDFEYSGMSWLKKSLLLLLVLVVAGIGVVLVSTTADAVVDLSKMNLADMTRVIRWGVAGAVFIFWDNLIVIWGKSKSLSDEQIERAISMRWRVAGWFAAFELIVIEALPVRFLGNL